MRKLLIALAFLFAPLVAPSVVLAGGGPIQLSAFALRPFDQTKTFILQSDVYTSQPCNQIKPTFSFKDTTSGDSITPFTPPNDGTYLTRHYLTTNLADFTANEVCTTYVQAKSGETRQRTAIVTAVVDGQAQTRELLVSFGDDNISKQIQGFGRVNDYDNTPQIDILSGRDLGGPKREVKVQWQKIAWASKYAVFAREVSREGNVIEPTFPVATTTSETRATLNLAKGSDFYLSVLACKSDDPCINQKENMYEYLLPWVQSGASEVKLLVPSVVPNEITQVYLPDQVNSSQAQIDELNQKVASLEGQLAESKVKQNILEEKLSGLMDLLRRFLPFLR